MTQARLRQGLRSRRLPQSQPFQQIRRGGLGVGQAEAIRAEQLQKLQPRRGALAVVIPDGAAVRKAQVGTAVALGIIAQGALGQVVLNVAAPGGGKGRGAPPGGALGAEAHGEVGDVLQGAEAGVQLLQRLRR